jgi:L-alanine-DL-glutamate epimerase-like enolase superfamily enzyme
VDTEDDALFGLGETAPTIVITGDSFGSIVSAVQDVLAPAIIGMDLDYPELIFDKIASSMVHNSSPKAALDIAIYDLLAKRSNLPLYRYLGGAQTAVQNDVTISLNPLDQMVHDSVEAAMQGYDVLKIKVGSSEHDVEIIRCIRQEVGDEITLRVDANQGWTQKSAIRMIKTMEDLDLKIELVEQPVVASDVDGLRAITSAVSTPILADEAVFTPKDAVHIITTHAADMINIKLMKCAGIHEALKILAIASVYHVPVMIGSMLEGRLSVSAAAHLACSSMSVVTADLDGPLLLTYDPFSGGPTFEGSSIRMKDLPGIGITSFPTDATFIS